MKYKCMIVDSKPSAINILKNYVETLETLEITGTCNDAFKAIGILLKEKIDLLFLDVDVANLLTVQMLNNSQYSPKVILTTAHKDNGDLLSEPDIIDYLPKPISYELFLKTVIKFYHIRNTEKVDTNDISPGFLYFRADRKMVKVILDDITYIESFKDYIVIHRQNNTELKVKYAIGSVEAMLPHKLFLRIHRSFIVSINKVTAFTNNDVEIGKIKLPIGRSYPYVYKRLTCDSTFIPNEEHK